VQLLEAEKPTRGKLPLFAFAIFIQTARHCFQSINETWHIQFSMSNNYIHWKKRVNNEHQQDKTRSTTEIVKRK
jgi:hypothetical protein